MGEDEGKVFSAQEPNIRRLKEAKKEAKRDPKLLLRKDN